MDLLLEHHRRSAVRVGEHGTLLGSAATRGFPDPAPGLTTLLDGVPVLGGRLADLTGSGGGGALARGYTRVEVLEPSFAGLRAARDCFADDPSVLVRAGLPWDLEPRRYDTALLLPPTDRGTDRVRAEIAAAARALQPEGVAYAAMHKDQGAKRYEREAEGAFAEVTVLSRRRGWRLVRLARPKAGYAPGERTAPIEPEREAGVPWRRFEALGREAWALPGVFAARRLDVGSEVLLEALFALGNAPLAGAVALDLGCGTGLLSRAALDAGAVRVVAVDDDLAAVRSAARTLAGASAEVVHSDLDAALTATARFGAVLVNPPFHVGKQVRLSVSRAFLATARRRLEPGGVALIVANKALPYERELAAWQRFETLREERGFKVLRAWR